MAKRNLDEVLKDYRGNTMRMVNPLTTPPKEEDMTLGLVCGVACWTSPADGSDSQLPMKEKSDLYKLGDRCLAGGVKEFEVTELATLKARIAKIFMTAPMGRAHEMLDRDWTATVLDMPKQAAQGAAS
jgi:hypothetical protein